MTATVPDLRRTPAGCPRLLAGWTETGGPADLAAHRARYGPLPRPAGRSGRAALVDEVTRSGLRGRGGGAFPTGRKLAAVAAGRGPRVVVANGCEGDPASAKDRVLLRLAPHLVLDGLVLAAVAVGAGEALLCLPEAGAPGLDAAVAQRADDPVAIRLVEVPARYVASEESALVHFLTSGDARPTVTPPRPAQRGVRGRPTLVDNVETLAHLALVARYGAGWFRACGTEAAPGTALVTVGGAVQYPGVYETELGVPLGAVLEPAGGVPEGGTAVLVGGLGGSWLPLPLATGIPFTPEDLRAAGALGGGVTALTVLPARACGLAETARVLRYLAAESAGQCGPCMFGLPAIAGDLTALAAGRPAPLGGRVGLARLRRRLEVVPGRGACAHPDGAAALAASALTAFAEDLAAHAAGRRCPWTGVPTWLPLPGNSR